MCRSNFNPCKRCNNDCQPSNHYAWPCRQPRVVLLDYNLPGSTGLQVAGHPRALLPNVAIILMSGRIDGVSDKLL